MTREEAIITLSFLRSEYNCFDEGRERYHALSMAIESLKQEPCEDCVSRQAAIDAIETYLDEYNDLDIEGLHSEKWCAMSEARMVLEELPSVERVGHWVLVKGSNGKDYDKCSECLHTQEITGVKNYCAVCGARMVSEDE